jgi:hypothetical protein
MLNASLLKKLNRSSVANTNEKVQMATSMAKMIHRGVVVAEGNRVL